MILALVALWGCGSEGCLDGQPGCRVEPACEDLQFTCDGGEARHYRVDPGGVELTGNQAVMSPGDWVLRNSKVMAVISDLPHPHYLAPTGGNLVDLATIAADGSVEQNDSIRNFYQVGGLLPNEAASYTEIEAYMDGDKAVIQVRGTYDDDANVVIATRYELGPCDPGIRVRTELINLHGDPESVFLADGVYLGGRESLSFAPVPGVGFDHPAFGLSTLVDGLRKGPWIAHGVHENPGSTQSITPCDRQQITSMMSEEISASGVDPTMLYRGDYLTYERFIGVGAGASIAAGSDIALDVRKQLFDEDFLEVSGSITKPVEDGRGFASGRPQVVIWEGDITPEPGNKDQTAWTHVEPDENGAFSFRVPRGGTYTAQLERFGLPWGRATFDASGDSASVEVPMRPAGQVRLDVTVNGAHDYALVVVWPSDEATKEAVNAKYLGHFLKCAPQLGHPYGKTPSCNRILLDGPDTFDIPPGTYDFYTAAGPFSSMDSATQVVIPEWSTGDAPIEVQLAVNELDILDPGMLTADFHVHGSASFDSSIPDSDRVRAFLASRLDVIAATDHDKVHDYQQAVAELHADERLQLLIGLETTGHILQPLLDDSIYPKVIGHWIVWPLQHDPEGPWRGAPWDEKALPGELFDRFEASGWNPSTGVIQLNHPWGGSQFGRDFGWGAALEMNLNQHLSDPDAPVGHAVFSATPAGARNANDAYHVQEVMNGTNNGFFLQYRALWHYLLNEGTVRAGTANSDSHTLGGNILGYPLNVVSVDPNMTDFNQRDFNATVKRGQMFGTTGPVLLARLEQDGVAHTPQVDTVFPQTGQVFLEVRAAEWVGVEEVRVYVDGKLAETATPAMAPDPHRPGVLRAELQWAVADLVSGSGDHWINFEAGAPLLESADFNCDGVPDTDDNNGDGTVDWHDIEAYAEAESPPEPDENGCYEESGPLDGVIEEGALPTTAYAALVPQGYPLGFTNPFLIDGDGSGAYEGVSR